MRKSISHIGRATILSLLLASPLALAQQGQNPPPQTHQSPGGAAPVTSFSDQQLNRFADSYIDILEIQQVFTAKLERAEEPQQAQELQQEANQKMIGAIEDNGLNVQEYTEIARAMDTDHDLREQVIQLVSARQ